MNDALAMDALLTLAELGLGLVGFSALVLAVTRPDVPLNVEQALQLRELVRSGLAAVFWSLLPIGLSLGGLVGVRLWRLMSGVQLVALMLASAWVIWQRRSVPREEQEQFLTLTIAVLAGIMVLLQLANVVGWPGQPSPAPYFFAVVVFLMMCAVYFMRLLFARLL